MKKVYIILLVVSLLSIPILFSSDTLTPEEILDRIDENMAFESARSEVEMILTIGKRTIKKTLSSYSIGTDKSFIEFLSPARDKGTKILKRDGIIRIYYPSAERVMRLSGHMLRQSMMGSDFSYEDMTERARKLREEYRAEIEGEETVNERPCILLTLTSTIENQTYYQRKIWVDKELFVGMKEELYARSGKLLKVMTVNEIGSFRKRHYPVRISMEDKLRQGTRTEMHVTQIEFDIDIPSETFSERSLMRR